MRRLVGRPGLARSVWNPVVVGLVLAVLGSVLALVPQSAETAEAATAQPPRGQGVDRGEIERGENQPAPPTRPGEPRDGTVTGADGTASFDPLTGETVRGDLEVVPPVDLGGATPVDERPGVDLVDAGEAGVFTDRPSPSTLPGERGFDPTRSVVVGEETTPILAVYENPDGSRTDFMTTSPVRTQDPVTGRWEQIDSTVVDRGPGRGLGPRRPLVEVRIPDRIAVQASDGAPLPPGTPGAAAPVAVAEIAGESLGLGVPQLVEASGAVDESRSPGRGRVVNEAPADGRAAGLEDGSADVGAGAAEGVPSAEEARQVPGLSLEAQPATSVVLFDDALPGGGDLEVEPTAGGVKLTYVISSREELAAGLTEYLTLPEGWRVEQLGSSVAVFDETGEHVATWSAGPVYDSSPEPREPDPYWVGSSSLRLLSVEGGVATAEVVVDEAWLERDLVFPLFVDPQLETYFPAWDTWIGSGLPTTSHEYDPNLWVGPLYGDNATM